jgi:hypothetical protein
MTPSYVGPTDLGLISGLQVPHSGERRLWPVYLASEMQQDTPMLFELGDIVTWPVCIADISGPDSGWPQDVAVETALTLQAGPYPHPRGRLAVTAEFSVAWRGSEPVGSTRHIAAGLVADFFNPPFLTNLTGSVRRIEITSSPYTQRESGARGVWYSDGTWNLENVSVAPLRFQHDHPGDPSARREHGLLVHLELMTPRCRCQEIKSIAGDQATAYARRHLQQTGADLASGVTDYVCPVTAVPWRLDHPEIPSGWRPPRLRRGDGPGSPTSEAR